MARSGRMFITGPDVVRSVTGENIDMEGLGGIDAHGRRSGVVHVGCDTEPDAYAQTRRLVSFISRPGSFDLRAASDGRDPGAAVPSSARRAYDVRPVIKYILDPQTDGFLELQPRWAANMVTGFGRITGRTIGVIANNPIRRGGCLDNLSAEKAARFVRMCDAFGVPLLVVVDVPGYLPGVKQEWDGVVRRGAKLLHAFAESLVPRVTLITRKSYGGAYIAMNSRSLGATWVLAWPDAEVAVMGAEAAVEVLYRKRLAAADEADKAALRAQFIAEHRERAGGVQRGIELGVIDEMVVSADTRARVAAALAAAPGGRGHHGNIPL
jgi:acetyl-CoA/propionyl-CoA carboxylase carboxyl transferase subunit